MKSKILNASFWIGIFGFFVLLTGIIFHQRIAHIYTHYAMPDIDTDGGLWYQWFLVYKDQHGLVYDLVNLEAYPFGYDIAFSPSENLIYSTQVFIMEHVIGYSWQNLIFMTNFSSLVVYPFSAMSAALLTYYLTRNKTVSFIGGLLYGFTFYLIFLGRGEMSINHLEFVPLYFLSLLYFLDRKNTLSLIISVLFFSLMFQADPYYAFFSGVFSGLILLFYKKASLAETLKTLFTYYFWLFTVAILTNFNFVTGNLYLFDKTQLVESGRNSLPQNELLPLSYYFTQPVNSWLLINFGQLTQFLALVVPGIAFLGVALARKNRSYFVFFACYLLAVVLSSYVPDLFWMNVLYFRFFGMFRGVARLNMFAFLFTNLLVALVLTKILQHSLVQKQRKFLVWIGLLVLVVIIIATSINQDSTWQKTSSFAAIAQLYQPIKDNPNIHTIATYPMSLGADTTGFPSTYQLMGQIIHNKPLVSGASTFSQLDINYRLKVIDINNPQTIDHLAHYGIDTILIYNKLLSNSDAINQQLQHDPRLQFIGHLTAPNDPGFVSALDLSKDINVYQIKDVVAKDTQQAPTFYTDNNMSISSQKISAQKYTLTVNNLHETTTLVYNFPYSEKWQLYVGDLSKATTLSFLNRQPVLSDLHTVFNEYQNGWTIDPAVIKKTFPKDSFTTNSDGSINLQLTMFFQPEARYRLGDLISLSTFIVCILVILFGIIKKVRKK